MGLYICYTRFVCFSLVFLLLITAQSPQRMLAVFREWTSNTELDQLSSSKNNQMKNLLKEHIPTSQAVTIK